MGWGRTGEQTCAAQGLLPRKATKRGGHFCNGPQHAAQRRRQGLQSSLFSWSLSLLISHTLHCAAEAISTALFHWPSCPARSLPCPSSSPRPSAAVDLSLLQTALGRPNLPKTTNVLSPPSDSSLLASARVMCWAWPLGNGIFISPPSYHGLKLHTHVIRCRRLGRASSSANTTPLSPLSARAVMWPQNPGCPVDMPFALRLGPRCFNRLGGWPVRRWHSTYPTPICHAGLPRSHHALTCCCCVAGPTTEIPGKVPCLFPSCWSLGRSRTGDACQIAALAPFQPHRPRRSPDFRAQIAPHHSAETSPTSRPGSRDSWSRDGGGGGGGDDKGGRGVSVVVPPRERQPFVGRSKDSTAEPWLYFLLTHTQGKYLRASYTYTRECFGVYCMVVTWPVAIALCCIATVRCCLLP